MRNSLRKYLCSAVVNGQTVTRVVTAYNCHMATRTASVFFGKRVAVVVEEVLS